MNSILKKVEGGVCILTLNRPEVFNSFNREMALALQIELDAANQDDTIRAVLITGMGKAFCAGQDLNEAISKEGPGITKIVKEHYNPIILKIRNLSKPVIAAVNGIAAGAGANIALACDLVIASESAGFIQAFSKIGLIPDSGGTFMLPRLVGYQRAAALMMTGEKVSAPEAVKMGMIYKAVAEANLAEDAIQLARTLSDMPTKAFAFTKSLLNQSGQHTLEQQLEAEAIFQEKAAATHDYREGVNAFLEKRKAVFLGK